MRFSKLYIKRICDPIRSFGTSKAEEQFANRAEKVSTSDWPNNEGSLSWRQMPVLATTASMARRKEELASGSPNTVPASPEKRKSSPKKRRSKSATPLPGGIGSPPAKQIQVEGDPVGHPFWDAMGARAGSPTRSKVVISPRNMLQRLDQLDISQKPKRRAEVQSSKLSANIAFFKGGGAPDNNLQVKVRRVRT